MRYINGVDVLPEELLNEIRKYAEGVYIYIPKSNLKKSKWGENTHYHREMELRNLHIYDKYLEGIEVEELADCYHLSIKSIRRIILLQKRKAEPMKAMVKEIIKQWNMEGNPIQIYHSAWNINELYVLKEYSDEKILKRNIEMMKVLYKAGIPVPKLIKLPKGDDYFEEDGRMYVLTTKLKGKNIVDISQCDDQWFFEFGTILARLHIAFRECEEKISYWKNSMLEEMNGWVSSSLDKFHPEHLCEGDIEDSIFQLSEVYNQLPKQLIHRDVYLGNFLFDNKSFSGYIDFDLSQSNIRIFDLCYFLLGLHLDEDNNKVQGKRWYKIVGQVISGYDSLMALSEIEKQAIPCIMKNIELLFTAYFLNIGDEKHAEDAIDLFLFVKDNEERILDAILPF